MNNTRTASASRRRGAPATKELLEQYGCGPISFTGTGDALYERHLMFDNVVKQTGAPISYDFRENYSGKASGVSTATNWGTPIRTGAQLQLYATGAQLGLSNPTPKDNWPDNLRKDGNTHQF